MEQSPVSAVPPTSENAVPRRGKCPTCGKYFKREEEPRSGKSAVQKRFDQLSREKYQALRQVETLRRDVAAAMDKLAKAEDLLRQYRGELEKYRSRFVEIVAKEKHGKR
jgi:DNA repair exonuclease SbcCD ATPase subunit